MKQNSFRLRTLLISDSYTQPDRDQEQIRQAKLSRKKAPSACKVKGRILSLVCSPFTVLGTKIMADLGMLKLMK